MRKEIKTQIWVLTQDKIVMRKLKKRRSDGNLESDADIFGKLLKKALRKEMEAMSKVNFDSGEMKKNGRW